MPLTSVAALWENTKKFMELHPEHVAPDNSMWWISETNGDTYNLCHFWSNFGPHHFRDPISA
jgi:alpha 1,2-mannosyltransferase